MMFRALFTSALFVFFAGCGQQAEEESPEDSSYVGVTVVAVVPEATGEVFLASNRNGWSADASPMTPDTDNERRRIAQVLLEKGFQLEYKFTLGSWEREAVGENEVPYQNFRLTAEEGLVAEHEVPGFRRTRSELMADTEGSGVVGTLIHWPDFASEHLERTRHVSIWLPPGYDAPENQDRRYPVIYMTDGQNLFDPRLANYGIDWGVDEAMVRGVERGAFEPAIIVSHFSTNNRGQEYSPWHDAPLLARLVIEELKPRVDSEFRTLTDRVNTYTMGSSMGGLHSMYLVLNHPDVFSACGCVSSHLPLSEAIVSRYLGMEIEGEPDPTPFFERDIEAGGLIPPAGARMFFDWGTATLDAEYPEPHARLREHLLGLGLTEGEDVLFREYPGAKHNEAAWRVRVEDQLEWMLGKTVPAPRSPLVGYEWVVEDVSSRGVIDSSRITLEFSADGRLSGTAGCNRFTGSYEEDGSTLSVGPLGTTRRMCPEALMNQEQAVLDALSAAERYSFDAAGSLTISGPDDRSLLARTD